MTPERKQALQEHSQAVAKIARKCPSSPSPEAVPTSMDYCRFGVQVALEPKCTLRTDSCDNDKVSTFFNASFSARIKALRGFFL